MGQSLLIGRRLVGVAGAIGFAAMCSARLGVILLLALIAIWGLYRG